MSTTLTRWRGTAFGPFDWSGLLPAFSSEIRIEQYVDHGQYVVRAELPGFDPETEITLTVAEGLLRIQAERTESKREKAHSEFHYGQSVRTVALPAGAMESTATAQYAEGILEISFELGDPTESSKRIPIEIAKGHTPKAAKAK